MGINIASCLLILLMRVFFFGYIGVYINFVLLFIKIKIDIKIVLLFLDFIHPYVRTSYRTGKKVLFIHFINRMCTSGFFFRASYKAIIID